MPGSWRKGGWKEKYVVAGKTDGTPLDDDAVYFVLRLDEDPNARIAALVYAASVSLGNGDLAFDIRRRLAALDGGDAADPLTAKRAAISVREIIAWAGLRGADIWDEEGLRDLRREIVEREEGH